MRESVPFLDVKATYEELRSELDAATLRVLESGWFIRGREVTTFEKAFAGYCEAERAVGVSNGLDALQLILRSWDIGAGDEVIVPAQTFVATWLAVSYAGATPVPVDVDPHTYNLDPERVEEAVTKRTRALLPVHLFGQPADMDALTGIAQRNGLRVVEDAAQAHGARYRGRRCGGLADAAAFSFYPGKNLGAFGDGGAVTTNDHAVAERIQSLANYGSREKYVHEEAGMNCRLDEIQAAVLNVKLQHLDAWNARRQEAAQRYLDALAQVPDLVLPTVPEWAEPSWHLFVVTHPRRDALQASMAEAGVASLIHYPTPPHRSPVYDKLGWPSGAFPVAEQLAEQALSLPIGPHLDGAMQDRVIECIQKFGGR